MPQEVTAFLAEDGSLHANACDAASKDIELLIAGSPLAENQPYARTVLEWLTSDPVAICQRLEDYHHACPKAVEEEAPSETLERTRSSGEHANYCAANNGHDCDCGANNGD